MNSILIALPVIAIIIAALFLLKGRKKNTPPALKNVKKELKKMGKGYENIPLYEGDSSYTENKTTIYICLKHPTTKQVYDMNTLLYVTLHEIGHVITEEYDEHGPKWKKNFSKLLNIAYKKGIYDPTKSVPKDYCGIKSKKKK